MMDNLQLAREALGALPTAHGERGRQLASILAEIEALLKGAQTVGDPVAAAEAARRKGGHGGPGYPPAVEADGLRISPSGSRR